MDPPVVLGPMAGVTDQSFRLLCKEQGCGLVCTEMVSAKAISYHNKNTESMLKTEESEHPVSMQLFGAEPDILGEVTAQLQDEAFEIIDLNMGCPVPKVAGNGEGSALMKNPELAAPSRVVLLEGFQDLTEERAAFVRRLLAGGRTVVLFAGTGAAGGAERLGLKAIYRKPPVDHEIQSLTGDNAEFRSAFYTDWLRWSLGVTGGPIVANWRPACFAFEDAPVFKPLARYVADGATAAVEGKVGGGRLVALGESNGLTPEFFNRLAREAGAYVPVAGGGNLQVDMNGDFVSVHALKTGRFDFRLPFPCEVVNLKTGKPVATSDGILPLDLTAGETRWYSLNRD